MDLSRYLIYLPIGTMAMLIPILLQGTWYQIKWNKCVLIAILLTIAGTLGTFLLFFIENGRFGGTSFFGAIFFVPALFMFVAKLLKIRFGLLLDLCAPAECMMLVIMKIQCYLTDCCSGIQMMLGDRSFVFPSQIAELTTALILCIVLLIMSRNLKNRSKIFPWYMVLYGSTRFVLNIFRKTGIVSFLHMPFGNFWSLVAIVIGIVWIWNRKKRSDTVSVSSTSNS